MCDKRSKIFARIIIHPNHFNAGSLWWKCLSPRKNDNDGTSIVKCSDFEQDGLIKRGEEIADYAKQTFHGILFFLEQSIINKFELIENSKKKHYSIKHSDLLHLKKYGEEFPHDDPDIGTDYNELFEECIYIEADKINTIKWDKLYDKLIDLINTVNTNND